MSINLQGWFSEKIQDVSCAETTKAYIVSVLHKYSLSSEDDLSKSSLVLTFLNANGNFQTYQTIGDWVLWLGIFCPNELKLHGTTYMTLACTSYDRCYKILNRKWELYEELSNRLPQIVLETHNVMQRQNDVEKLLLKKTL